MLTHNKSIGRVLSVDNFRVFIRIDDDLRGAYKSGINDIYEIARINSYLIIPVGAERVVALITRITMREEMEFDHTSSTIMLPSSARYISATMLGTIAKDGDKDKFIQGVYNFPTLNNPVWYVTERDLAQIFDDHQDNFSINYAKDFYLPIGTSPAFSNYSVKICPDQFFVKHAAILGNTGSGKSCTFTSIIRNLFRYDYNGSKLENAHFVLFDTNGEYKDAFLPNSENYDKLGPKVQEELNQINAYYYGGDDYPKVPYWFMNWADFKELLKPSDGTQAPILNRAIGLAKNDTESIAEATLPRHLISEVENILVSSPEDIKKRTGQSNYGTWTWKTDNEIINIGVAIKAINDTLGNAIILLANQENFNNEAKQTPIREQIKTLFNKLVQQNIAAQITSEQNIDMPTWFSYRELCTKFIDAAITQESVSNSRISEFVSTLRLRMNSFLNDKRIAIPLMLKDSEINNRDILTHFIAFLLGDFNRCFEKTAANHLVKTYNEKNKPKDTTKSSQITIVDVSNLPFEILETVTALLGRIILEFVSHFVEDRGKYPIVIVLEEAQNYIAEQKDSVAKTVFERIAREGRKYGISLIVCSQRPSELSRTVLSQCNSFIIHRLQNPEDQKYVRGLVSSANADILEQLPVIPQQHAIITGDCVRTPIQVRIDDVNPTPNSHNPKYIERWLDSSLEIPYEDICDKWLDKKKD